MRWREPAPASLWERSHTELLIATNNHVVEGADSLSVGFVDESAVEGQIKGTDADNDLAVVAVKLSDISSDTMNQIKIATIGDSDDLVLGEQVVAIGNALGYGQSVTSGYVSALNRDLQLTDNSGNTINSTGLIQTDAPINSGNSGGALLNMNGELIGINEAKSSTTQSGTTVDGIGFAIPINKAEESLQSLMNQTTREKVDESQASYMGIQGADVSQEAAQMYGMPTGVAVSEVVKDGPADKAGILAGDVITGFDGRSISSMSQLKDTLQYYASGETVDVTVQRSDQGQYKEQSPGERYSRLRKRGAAEPAESAELRCKAFAGAELSLKPDARYAMSIIKKRNRKGKTTEAVCPRQ